MTPEQRKAALLMLTSKASGIHVVLGFDESLGVLSVELDDAHVVRGRPVPNDSTLVLKVDAEGRVVGIELLSPKDMTPEVWRSHSVRPQLPPEVFSTVEAWLRCQ